MKVFNGMEISGMIAKALIYLYFPLFWHGLAFHLKVFR